MSDLSCVDITDNKCLTYLALKLPIILPYEHATDGKTENCDLVESFDIGWHYFPNIPKKLLIKKVIIKNLSSLYLERDSNINLITFLYKQCFLVITRYERIILELEAKLALTKEKFEEALKTKIVAKEKYKK